MRGKSQLFAELQIVLLSRLLICQNTEIFNTKFELWGFWFLLLYKVISFTKGLFEFLSVVETDWHSPREDKFLINLLVFSKKDKIIYSW
jgi:hypothetical protein